MISEKPRHIRRPKKIRSKCLSLKDFNESHLKELRVSSLNDVINNQNLLGLGGTSVVYKLHIKIKEKNKDLKTVTAAAKILNNGDISDEQFFDEVQKMKEGQRLFGECVPKIYTCIYEPKALWCLKSKRGNETLISKVPLLFE